MQCRASFADDDRSASAIDFVALLNASKRKKVNDDATRYLHIEYMHTNRRLYVHEVRRGGGYKARAAARIGLKAKDCVCGALMQLWESLLPHEV